MAQFPSRIVFAVALFAAARLSAAVTPSPLFGDHAVLQAGRPVPVWGQADPGETVTVTFAGQTVTATTGSDGTWRITLDPLKVSATPAKLTFTGNTTIVSEDVLVGEVWLCSGQSNMNLKLAQSADAEAAIAAANVPLIRYLAVPTLAANEPASALKANWAICTPTTAGQFTAVGYYFARKIHETLGIPIGIIHASVGGTDIEAWMTPASIADDPALRFVGPNWQKRLDDFPRLQAEFEAKIAAAEQRAAEATAAGKPFKKPWIPKPPNPDGSPHRDKPSALFNGMVHPLVPTALAGVLWYQGENNITRAEEYRLLFPALITGWREVFARPDLPFFWVQLPNFNGFSPGSIAALREAQTTALTVPGTAQAITIDIGESKDIHPRNKRDVGERLARIALKKTYGQRVVASGPIFDRVTFSAGKAEISFTETAEGLKVRGDTLTGFEIAGANKTFHPATAQISGTTVIVESPAVPDPVAVRYAWQNDPQAGLANSEDLPAAPFRSDSW